MTHRYYRVLFTYITFLITCTLLSLSQDIWLNTWNYSNDWHYPTLIRSFFLTWLIASVWVLTTRVNILSLLVYNAYLTWNWEMPTHHNATLCLDCCLCMSVLSVAWLWGCWSYSLWSESKHWSYISTSTLLYQTLSEYCVYFVCSTDVLMCGMKNVIRGVVIWLGLLLPTV